VTTPKRDKLSLSRRDQSISFLDLSQYQNSTWELVEHDFAGGGGKQDFSQK
jgi:hypothetical protein